MKSRMLIILIVTDQGEALYDIPYDSKWLPCHNKFVGTEDGDEIEKLILELMEYLETQRNLWSGDDPITLVPCSYTVLCTGQVF